MHSELCWQRKRVSESVLSHSTVGRGEWIRLKNDQRIEKSRELRLIMRLHNRCYQMLRLLSHFVFFWDQQRQGPVSYESVLHIYHLPQFGLTPFFQLALVAERLSWTSC